MCFANVIILCMTHGILVQILTLVSSIWMQLLSSCIRYCYFFSSRRRHTRYWRDWSSDVCSSDLVDTAGSMESALDGQSWDLVIADHSMPAFSSSAALELLRRKGFVDVPFIIVSGQDRKSVV